MSAITKASEISPQRTIIHQPEILRHCQKNRCREISATFRKNCATKSADKHSFVKLCDEKFTGTRATLSKDSDSQSADVQNVSQQCDAKCADRHSVSKHCARSSKRGPAWKAIVGWKIITFE